MTLEELKHAVEIAEQASDRNVDDKYLLGLIARGIYHLALQVGLLREDLRYRAASIKVSDEVTAK